MFFSLFIAVQKYSDREKRISF